MRTLQPAFLLIELLILILLVTLLLSLFLGGEAHLLKIQSDATKKLQELNVLLNEREQQRSMNAGRFERHALTRPVVTGNVEDIHKQWVPKVECLAAISKKGSQQGRVLLPLIGFSNRVETV